MTFHKASKTKPVLAIVILLLFGALAAVLYFSIKSCSGTGFFRSAKSSDANYLYQVYPASLNGTEYFLSLEGIFKTSIYERKGGITMRSGSTELRLTLHNLSNGEIVAREVIGNYHDKYSGIVGTRDSICWMYNKEDGLHGRNIPGLQITVTQEDIIAANPQLSEGLAMAQETLTNLEELFAFSREYNALMLTTVTGKKIWVDGNSFKTIEAPLAYLPNTDFNDIIAQTIEMAQHGETINISQITDQIIRATTGVGNMFSIQHMANQIVAFDSCTYTLNGNTIKTIEKTQCPQPVPVKNILQSGVQFIEPKLVGAYGNAEYRSVNPTFLDPTVSIITHSKAMGEKSELLISVVNNTSLEKQFTIASGIILSNHNSGYKTTAVFGTQDTLVIGIDNQLFCVNTTSGKLIWKKTIAQNDYHAQLLSVGEGIYNNKRYLIVTNSYFTILSKQGVFINGRTDYQQMVIDYKTGKTLKQTNITNSKPESLPYYCGNTSGKNWFYTDENGLHTRTLPDLKVDDTNFSKSLKSTNINSALVKSSGYGRVMDEKYIGFDSKKGMFYFTTENGLHYSYELSSNKITEISAPEDKLLTTFKMENTALNYYYNNFYYSAPNELILNGGNKLLVERKNNTSLLTAVSAKKAPAADSGNNPNQFIEGQFLVNGIGLNKDIYYTDDHYNPVSNNIKEPYCYILHKNKIASDAHHIISKYNYQTQQITWSFDVNALLGIDGEISRIYSRKSSLIFIFKTHPDLDDNFTCVSINTETGNMEWVYKF
jgi:hypothetical protein